jgi:hypothetical protein
VTANYFNCFGSYDYVLYRKFGPSTQQQNQARPDIETRGMACILSNSYGLVGNIKHVYKTGDIYDDGQPLQRYNTLIGWQRMLEAHQLLPFKTLKYEIEPPRTFADLLWFLSHPLKICRLLFSVLIPVNLGNCIVYLCKRKI